MKKSVLVTGASSGIGASICKYLSDMGYYVVLLARDKGRLDEVAKTLNSECLCIPYDLQDLENIESIFETCKENDTKLYGLVHSAGINKDVPIRSNSVQDMVDVTSVNYYAFVELAKYFNKKKYSEDGASIIAISSEAAWGCKKGMCTYSASKAALNASVKVMAREFVKRKQRVNAILPAFVNTPMAVGSDYILGDLDEKLENQPLGLIEPIQIAYLTEFLLSEKASSITGALIPVSGGDIC